MVISADKGLFVYAADKKLPDLTEANPRFAETRTQFGSYMSRMGGSAYISELVEKELIVEALRRANGNQSRAAEMLGIPRPTLHARIQRHRVRTTTIVDEANVQKP